MTIARELSSRHVIRLKTGRCAPGACENDELATGVNRRDLPAAFERLKRAGTSIAPIKAAQTRGCNSGAIPTLIYKYNTQLSSYALRFSMTTSLQFDDKLVS